MDLNDLLREIVAREASDLHIKVGSPPHARVHGRLEPLPFDSVTPADTAAISESIIPALKVEDFERTSEADFALGVSGLGRFRVNVFRQRGSVGLVLRRVQAGAPTLEEINMPSSVRRLADEPRGLVLVTGPTGSGKTTTLAAMIDHINASRGVNIVTIEDPIEVLHQDKRSIINQREVGSDTLGFDQAMRSALRQDPDVIFIGEMRDPETVWAALSAAETGHLVLSTLHTINATETINRIVDFFPPFQQKQVRYTLASALRGVVSQRLIPRSDGTGRVAAVEVMVSTDRVADRIADPDAGSVEDVIAEGEFYGMQTFDQSLLELCKAGLAQPSDAMRAASNPHDLKLALQNAGFEVAR